MVYEVLYVCNISQCHEEWLLDYGVLDRLFTHRSWLYSYQAIDDNNVFSEKNVSCKTVEIGSIKIKMFDDIVWRLKKVRDVP